MSAKGERPFHFHTRMHGTALEPWWGRGAWWRGEPGGGFWGTVLITIPVSVAFTLVDWLCWQVRRWWSRRPTKPR